MKKMFNALASAYQYAGLALILPIIDWPTRFGLNLAGLGGMMALGAGYMTQNAELALGGVAIAGVTGGLFAMHGYGAEKKLIPD